MCFVVVEGVLDVDDFEELDLPPQAPIARLLASTQTSVSMAVSGDLFMAGRAPFVAVPIRRPPYQPLLGVR